MTPPVCLTVAATDSGGAAGTAADLTAFAALGTHGACVITAVTAQDTTGVRDVHPIPTDSVGHQLDAVFEDLLVAAVKTGMLGDAATVELLADRLAAVPDPPPLVVDPVLVATSGAVLGDDTVRKAYLAHLLPLATVVTPNLDEARALLEEDGPPDRLAGRLTELCGAVVLTGGSEGADHCTDWIAVRGRDPVRHDHPAVATENDHGTGCTYSSALAARLAHGDGLAAAAGNAAAYTAGQLRLSRSWGLGRGRGPIAHTTTTGGDA